jgi:hypothetical protein
MTVLGGGRGAYEIMRINIGTSSVKVVVELYSDFRLGGIDFERTVPTSLFVDVLR